MEYIQSSNTIIFSPEFNEELTNEYLEIISKSNKVIFSNYELDDELFEKRVFLLFIYLKKSLLIVYGNLKVQHICQYTQRNAAQ